VIRSTRRDEDLDIGPEISKHVDETIARESIQLAAADV
jgi:hypothetical protein